MSSIRFVVVLGALLTASNATRQNPLLVGVLEHPQCKAEVPVGVRVLFAKEATEWIALHTAQVSRGIDLSNLAWTVTLDGRSLGRLRTLDPGYSSPYGWGYARDRLLMVAAGQSVPRVINKAKLFGGWCDEPAHRPLVVVSEPNFRDPARWKPFKPDPAYRKELLPAFKSKVQKVTVCAPADDTTMRFEYGPDDMVLYPSYKDRAGGKLIAIGLNPVANNCDGPPGPEWSTHWFLLGEGGTRYLGSELSLVDAGDYDGDGRSELVFWHSGYNEDGYSLFYDKARRRVNFFWGYH